MSLCYFILQRQSSLDFNVYEGMRGKETTVKTPVLIVDGIMLHGPKIDKDPCTKLDTLCCQVDK